MFIPVDRRTVMVLCVGVLSLTLAACGGADKIDTGTASVVAYTPNVAPSEGRDAAVQGTLTVQQECMYLTANTGDFNVLVFRPKDLKLADDKKSVSYGRTTFKVGEPFIHGGDYVAKDALPEGTNIPKGCDQSKRFVVLHNPD